MKTLVSILWMVVFAVLITVQGICQQVMESKPPTEVTATGVIKTLLRGSRLVVSVPEESGRTHDLPIILPNDIKITMDGSAAKAFDLRVGKAVTVAYTTQNAVSSVTNVPAGETTAGTAKSNSEEAIYFLRHPGEKTVGTVKSISIIFGTNLPPADIKTMPQQASARIPDDFIGSWISIEEKGERTQAKTETMQITTNRIRWTRTTLRQVQHELDFHEENDSISNRLNDKGDVWFDAKVLLAKDVSSNATVILRVRDGKLIMKEGPSQVALDDHTSLSSKGEELVYVRDRTPTPPENKPSPGK